MRYPIKQMKFLTFWSFYPSSLFLKIISLSNVQGTVAALKSLLPYPLDIYFTLHSKVRSIYFIPASVSLKTFSHYSIIIDKFLKNILFHSHTSPLDPSELVIIHLYICNFTLLIQVISPSCTYSKQSAAKLFRCTT